ncbi:hypothetical protein PTKIN_Ptkin14bG0106600 [Pterospermum kingtungense]
MDNAGEFPSKSFDDYCATILGRGLLPFLSTILCKDHFHGPLLMGLCIGWDIRQERMADSAIPFWVLWGDWEDDQIKRLELWVTRKYGVVGSWTQVLHLTEQSGFGRIPWVLGFRKNGEVLLELYSEEMVSLDLNGRQMKNLIEAEAGISFVDSYVESLVLLDKRVDACRVNYAIPYNELTFLMHQSESEMT